MPERERKKIKVVFVTGPTASGKTSLAVKLAERFSCEIISADSRQVYKGMDIGTGKDISEYKDIRYHLIDIVHPADEYNLARFRQDAINAIQNIDSRKLLPIVCGGTVLYIDCLLSEYRLPGGRDCNREERKKLKSLSNEELLKILGEQLPPDEAGNINRIIRRIERKNSGNIAAETFPFELDPLIIAVLRDRSQIHSRIEERLQARFGQGMVEEVQRLHEQGISWEKLESFGLEYKFIAIYLQGKISKEELLIRLLARIRNFARRQDVWFRKLERKGHPIHWIKDGDPDSAAKLIEDFINGKSIQKPNFRLSEIDYGKKKFLP